MGHHADAGGVDALVDEGELGDHRRVRVKG